MAVSALWGSPAHAAADPPDANAPLPWCGTELTRPDRSAVEPEATTAGCPQQGGCDDPTVRDAAATGERTIRIIAHVLRNPDGTCGASTLQVQTAISEMDRFFQDNQTGIRFVLTAIRIHETTDAYVPGCNTPDCLASLRGIQLVKATYAESPESQCNIVFSCMRPSSDRLLVGLGTLPWSPDVTRAGGGIWVNSSEVFSRPAVLPHEMGHVLGLWHTFRGVGEVSCEHACVENAHDVDADHRGDFASDTPATPVNYSCREPGGVDCYGQSWAPTATGNLMNYADCARSFTPQQVRRMQCWSASALSGWFSTTPPTSPPIAIRVIPNPAGPEARLVFVLASAGRARLEVFDLLGRLVARPIEADLPAGATHITWMGKTDSGQQVRAGAYVVRVTSGGNVGKTMMLWAP